MSALALTADVSTGVRTVEKGQKPTWTSARWVGCEPLAALTLAGVPAAQNRPMLFRDPFKPNTPRRRSEGGRYREFASCVWRASPWPRTPAKREAPARSNEIPAR